MEKLKIDVLLLVEDEQDHAFLVLEALNGNGHLVNEIKWVKNAREAVDYVNQEGKYNATNAPTPALILPDVKMHELDGFEVLTILKSHEKHKLIPVVMLTTTANCEDVKRAMSLGCNDYIVKPVSWEDFEQKVRKLGQYWAMISNARIAKEK